MKITAIKTATPATTITIISETANNQDSMVVTIDLSDGPRPAPLDSGDLYGFSSIP